MKIKERQQRLENGTIVVLRSPDVKDALQIVNHLRQTSGESEYMARYPEEIRRSEQVEQEFLSRVAKNEKAFMVCAVINGIIVANAGISEVASYEKYCHRAEFGISVKKAYWGLGIASMMMPVILETAKKVGFEQLELEVAKENQRAVSLYEKFGFTTYGIREHSFKYKDGSYAALQLMIKML